MIYLVYVIIYRGNQEIVEEAFIPTLKTIMNAPSSSPLAEVNTENVAELLVHLTNSKHLMENQNTEAVIVCIYNVMFVIYHFIRGKTINMTIYKRKKFRKKGANCVTEFTCFWFIISVL